MKWTYLLATCLGVASAKFLVNPSEHSHQHIVSNPPTHEERYRIPSWRESTAMARKIMHLTTIGELVTVFPGPNAQAEGGDISLQENRPVDVAGSPIGLLEYIADCDPHSGNPILLAINIATPYTNYDRGSNISFSMRWWPERKDTYSLWAELDDYEGIPTPRTPVALPRLSLHGHLEDVLPERPDYERIQKCFLRSHPDSKYWQPGNGVSHASRYVQLVVEHVYWLGGFGDRARIGWLPMDDWRNLTMKEVIDTRLPGEHKSKSWWREWL